MKIEEVPQKKPTPTKSNPFASKKKATVKRDPKDVYPDLRKGLNKPAFHGNSPLDRTFEQLEAKLEGPIEDLTFEVLISRFGIDETDSNTLRCVLVERIFALLGDIQSYSNAISPADSNLIRISLHDMKTFGKLVNILLIHGIYPALNTFKAGVPFEKRRLNDLAKARKPIKIERLAEVRGAKKYTEKFGIVHRLLVLVYEGFKRLFSVPSDVHDLLIKGTGFTDFLTVAITLSTVPYFPDRTKYLGEFALVVTPLSDTFQLFQMYSLYLTTPSPSYFKQFVMQRLAALPYDATDGVRALCEFVLGMRDNDDINVEKFQHVANVVLSKPPSIPTVDYFKSIGSQLFTLLGAIDNPILTSCATFVVERLWEKNPRVATDFVLADLHKAFDPSSKLTSELALNHAVNVLITLTKSNTSSEFLDAAVVPILPLIWGYYVFLRKHDKNTAIIHSVLVSYFTVSESAEIDSIARNLTLEGGDGWHFEFGPSGLAQIAPDSLVKLESSDKKVNAFIESLDSVCVYFIELLKDLSDEVVQRVFVMIMRRWLGINSLAEDNAFMMLVNLRLLESIGSEFKDSLARTPKEMLELTKTFLLGHNKITDDAEGEDSDDEDELQNVLPIVLELLSAILTETPEIDEECRRLLQEIRSILSSLTQTAAVTSLHSRIEDVINGESKITTEADAHAKTLKRAITSLNDPLVPIRAHGLYLIRKLVEQKSDAILVDFAVNLHLVQLKDPEPYIYLNVIKGLESLLELNDDGVLHVLVPIYLDNEADIDERLRIGEVLLRFIQGKNELFSGQQATFVSTSMLSLIRRSETSVDDRVRMSAMSLLGTCCNTNPIGIVDSLPDALDCAIGILQLERDIDKAIMRRAAIVLIHDLIMGTSDSVVAFPKDYQTKVLTILKYITETDNDLLTREQASSVLSTIETITQAP